MNKETDLPESLEFLSPNLNKEEADYKLVIDGIEDYGIFMLNTDGHIISWNQGAQRIKGYTADEIIGQHFSVFYTRDAILSKYPQYELRMAEKDGKFEDSGWRIRKDGSTFWANVIITAMRGEHGELIGFSKVTRDLSLRKKAEDDLYRAFQELKESEERFRLMVEGVRDYAIFLLDAAGNVATWNKGAKNIKGYTADEIIGKHISRFYSSEDVERGYPQSVLEEARKNGRFEGEGWRYRKDGSAFWASVVITAIYNKEDELIGFSKITRDLTDRRQLEQQLYRANEEMRESEERARLLIEGVKDYAIFMLTPEGYVSSWNKGAERIKGYTASEIIGKHFSKFYSREALEKGFPKYELEQAKKDGRFEDEGWRIRKDGTAIWVNVVITAVYNKAGKLLGFTKITKDLSEKRKNEELMRKNQELLKINSDLDNFVYAASHDLKSPISNLEGLVNLLKEDMGDEGKKHEEVLERIDHSINRLRKVITDLTDITKVQQDTSQAEEVDLQELFDEVVDGMSDFISASKASVAADFREQNTLRYSRKNLRSILFNLISNAIKYASPDQKPEVKLKTQVVTSDTLLLSVTDNGLGIEPGQQQKIFSMFKRMHQHVEGSGLGLYIVKRILENSGDTIEVESEVGKGSTFKVYFKLA
ncbi:PAS domain-containing sensor histidine kinase [Pontibacter ruber]|uniref:histidine kinase n=1 Tax=Pontibacter ruber TaxID=1343895 RepID=A0ABW5CYU1_9BACT|nr:PAS domain-containing sensor histidine kinase [Pontibacter ruber]